jgi:hypothetical protein
MHTAILVSAMSAAKAKHCAHIPVLTAAMTVFVVRASLPMHQRILLARYDRITHYE